MAGSKENINNKSSMSMKRRDDTDNNYISPDDLPDKQLSIFDRSTIQQSEQEHRNLVNDQSMMS